MLRTYSPFLKTYLFAADRAWTYDRECLPALSSGSLVLWDRYVDSAIAYRSVELRLHKSRIDLEFVRHLNSPFMRPDLTLYIDVASETSLSRSVHNRKIELYNFDFLKQVRLEYLTLAAEQGYVIVDGERPLQIVAEEAASIIRDRLREMFK